ncbi:cytochrome P450 4C1-like [Vanessa cardui]|uniref:cytochrome P450 4C1-like n=1 Tax=Vanessa cardui TaxID=171605 RepID=UPI001F13405F|nr:cytochrome P450 4C1-like [Vanessa cardui]
MALVFIHLLTILFLCWILLTRRRKGEPPIADGCLPLIGHAYMVLGNSIQFTVLTDPDEITLVANMCLQKDSVFAEKCKELVGEGLLFSDVTTWKRHRKIILPTFNQQVLDTYLPIFNNKARKLVKIFEKESGNGPFDHSTYLRQLSLESICSTAMGVEVNDDEAVNYTKALHLAFGNGTVRYQTILLQFDFIYNLSNLKKEQDRCIEVLHEMTRQVLSKKQQEFEMSNNNKQGRNSFIEHLLSSNELSEKEIIDEVHNMIIAGSDTTSSVLLFTLILIGSYPETQKKILDELFYIFGDSDRDLVKQDLGKMTYTEAVLKESMRFLVMAPFVVRYIDKEVKLKNYTLKPGNNCFFSFYGVHRHDMWGHDADQFKPERWLEKDLPSNPNAYMAFSIGKRNCIGRSYAMMLMKTTLAHILRCYRIQSNHKQLEVKLDILIKPVSNYYISVENYKKC